MKLSDRTKKALADAQKTPGGKVKIDVGALKDFAVSDAVNRSCVMATVGMLAWIADNVPISFEERKNIDIVLDSLQNQDYNDSVAIAKSINQLTEIAGKYTR